MSKRVFCYIERGGFFILLTSVGHNSHQFTFFPINSKSWYIPKFCNWREEMWNRLTRIFYKQKYIVCVKWNMLWEPIYRDWLDICLLPNIRSQRLHRNCKKKWGQRTALPCPSINWKRSWDIMISHYWGFWTEIYCFYPLSKHAEPDFTKCDMFLGLHLFWPRNNIAINQSDLKNKFIHFLNFRLIISFCCLYICVLHL